MTVKTSDDLRLSAKIMLEELQELQALAANLGARWSEIDARITELEGQKAKGEPRA